MIQKGAGETVREQDKEAGEVKEGESRDGRGLGVRTCQTL